MRIEAPELADVVEAASRHAAAGERDAARRAAAEIRAARARADPASPGSRFLARLVEAGGGILEPAARDRLNAVALLGVGSDYVNAIPILAGAERCILVFEGLQRQLAYAIDLLKVLSLLQRHRPEASFVDGDETLPEALAFSLAGFAILADCVTEHRPPGLIADLLGPVARLDARNAYRQGLIFVLLHEIGHFELGHLQDGGARSERAQLGLIEPEPLSDYQADELAADAFALTQVRAEYRADLIPSLCFFFLPYVFLEAFTGGLSPSHPLAINRLAALVEAIEMPAETRAIVTDWVSARAQNLRDLAGQRRDHGGDLRPRLAARMPVRRAYEVVNAIRARVLAETGVLEDERDLTPAELRDILRHP